MKLLLPKVDVWGECPTNYDDAIKWIERAGRICYRSEDKIVEGSDVKFVNNILNRNHWSVIEQSNFVIRTILPQKSPYKTLEYYKGVFDCKFLSFYIANDYVYIGGNFRAWMEYLQLQTIEKLFTYFKSYTGLHIVEKTEIIPNALKRITVKYRTDRAVTHELVRHRPASFLQESQRYCAYRKHLEVIVPLYFRNMTSAKTIPYDIWRESIESSERHYRLLLEKGIRPEIARTVLPNSTATRIVVTASLSEWDLISKLRCHKAAYLDFRELACETKEILEARYGTVY